MHLETILLTVVINTTAGTESPLISFFGNPFRCSDYDPSVYSGKKTSRNEPSAHRHRGTRRYSIIYQYRSIL